MPGLGVFRRTKAQGVEAGDWPCPHGEDIAQNATHTGGRPLIGLDEGRMVVIWLEQGKLW